MNAIDRQNQKDVLTAALRSIRKKRRLRTADIADRMNMPPRSYEHFESGAGRVNLEHLHRFAKATDSDAHALIACLALGSPEFALRCADNKLMTILMVALQELDRDYGDTIAALDVRTLVSTFTHVLDQLGDLAERREQDARAWLEAGVERLTSPGATHTK